MVLERFSKSHFFEKKSVYSNCYRSAWNGGGAATNDKATAGPRKKQKSDPSHPKSPPSHLQVTSKSPQVIARPRQSHPQVTSKSPPSHLHATSASPPSHPLLRGARGEVVASRYNAPPTLRRTSLAGLAKKTTRAFFLLVRLAAPCGLPRGARRV